MFARNPKTRYINAHFGWHGNDFGRAARHLDSLPNVVFEVGAVLYEFGRQPRAAREFFIKYQDRVLFGKDTYEPSRIPVLLARVRDQRRILRLLPRTITRSGSCTAWTCPTTCCASSITGTPCG